MSLEMQERLELPHKVYRKPSEKPFSSLVSLYIGSRPVDYIGAVGLCPVRSLCCCPLMTFSPQSIDISCPFPESVADGFTLTLRGYVPQPRSTLDVDQLFPLFHTIRISLVMQNQGNLKWLHAYWFCTTISLLLFPDQFFTCVESEGMPMAVHGIPPRETRSVYFCCIVFHV